MFWCRLKKRSKISYFSRCIIMYWIRKGVSRIVSWHENSALMYCFTPTYIILSCSINIYKIYVHIYMPLTLCKCMLTDWIRKFPLDLKCMCGILHRDKSWSLFSEQNCMYLLWKDSCLSDRLYQACHCYWPLYPLRIVYKLMYHPLL